MIKNIIINNLEKYKNDIEKINASRNIDCITIFSISEEDYELLNIEMQKCGYIIDNMSSGNLYYIENGITTIYGKLHFIKIRKYDKNYLEYRISVNFTVQDYEVFKNSINNPIIKVYDTFELIQFKNGNSIINIISLSAKDDYKL